jgi:hypothetical protein
MAEATSDALRAITDRLGAPPLDAAEQAAVLDLTREVAYATERRFAPLTAYALGLALAGVEDPAARTRRVRAAIQALEGGASDPGP